MAVVVTCVGVLPSGCLMFGPYGSVIDPDQKKHGFDIFVDHDYFHHVFETPIYMYNDKLIQCVSWEIQKSALKHKSCIFVIDIMFLDGTHLCHTNIVKQDDSLSHKILLDDLAFSHPPFGTQECSCRIDTSKLHWFKVLEGEFIDILVNGHKITKRTVLPDNTVNFTLTKGNQLFTIRNKDMTFHVITSIYVSLKDHLSVVAITDQNHALFGEYKDNKFDIHKFNDLIVVHPFLYEGKKAVMSSDGPIFVNPFITTKEDNLGKEKQDATNTNKIDENDIKKCLLSNIKQIIESSNSRLSDEAMCKCKQLIELILHTESWRASMNSSK